MPYDDVFTKKEKAFLRLQGIDWINNIDTYDHALYFNMGHHFENKDDTRVQIVIIEEILNEIIFEYLQYNGWVLMLCGAEEYWFVRNKYDN